MIFDPDIENSRKITHFCLSIDQFWFYWFLSKLTAGKISCLVILTDRAKHDTKVLIYRPERLKITLWPFSSTWAGHRSNGRKRNVNCFWIILHSAIINELGRAASWRRSLIFSLDGQLTDGLDSETREVCGLMCVHMPNWPLHFAHSERTWYRLTWSTRSFNHFL